MLFTISDQCFGWRAVYFLFFFQPTVVIPLSQQMVPFMGQMKTQLRELWLCLDVTHAGFIQTENMTAVCASDGRWIPDPATLVCTCKSTYSHLQYKKLWVGGVGSRLYNVCTFLWSTLCLNRNQCVCCVLEHLETIIIRLVFTDICNAVGVPWTCTCILACVAYILEPTVPSVLDVTNIPDACCE